MKQTETLRESVERWVEEQGEWISDPLFAPALTQLRLLSDGIDAEPTKASLHSQFGMTYRNLLDERPKEDPTEDALDLLLRNSASEMVSNE